MHGPNGNTSTFRGGRGTDNRPATGTYENRFTTLNSESEGEAWHEVGKGKGKNKRQRRSTGGTYEQHGQSSGAGVRREWGQPVLFKTMNKEEFKRLPNDDKLVTMFETLAEIGTLYGRVYNVEEQVDYLTSSDKAQNERLKLLEYKSIDMEARSRRNNLIFRGHPENVENDDCVAIIRQHLANRLGLRPDVCIQRAHRLGNFNNRRRRFRWGEARPQPRPIIVNFRDYEVVELILENAKKLKDTPFGVNRDYPKEIISARSKLWAEYKKAREENAKGTVYIGYPAKLIVNKRVVRDEFPDWRHVLNGSRVQDSQGPNREQNGSARGNITQNGDRVANDNIQGNTSGTRQLIVEIGDDNGDGSADEVVSMASERSRSNSRSRSPSNDRSGIVSRDELMSIVSSTPTGAGAGASTSKSYADLSDNHKSAGQNERVSKSVDEGLTPYDIAMKELETRSELAVRPKDSSKNKSDTGQTHSQRPK